MKIPIGMIQTVSKTRARAARALGLAGLKRVGSHRTRQGPTPATSKRYQRHEPETTPLYKIVAEHIGTYLAGARETLALRGG